MGGLTASMERDVRLRTIRSELDIQRRGVGRPRESRGDEVITADRVGRNVRRRGRELVADLQGAEARSRRIPHRIALRIAIVTPLATPARSVQEAVEVQLLPGIVLVDIDAVALDVVDGILDAENAARGRLLGHADRVAQTPAEQRARRWRRVGVRLVRQHAHVEGADLRDARRGIPRERVVVLAAALGHEEHARHFLRHEEGAGRVAAVVHLVDDDLLIPADRSRCRVVVPCKHLLWRRGE